MIIMFVSLQSDSFPRQPNVLGLIEMEESGQESGNVDKIQHHHKPPLRLPTVDSSQSGLASSRALELAACDWPEALTGCERRKNSPAAPLKG